MNGPVTTSQQSPGKLVSGSKLVDDFLRRELRVGDPTSATEVATALRTRYATDAARMDEEGRGMSLAFGPETALPVATSTRGDTAGSREERRVRANLEADLEALIISPNNREWKPELTGWRDTLTREFAEGAAAARFAQDPAMRQRGFYCVRKLSEFARLARLLAVTNLPLTRDYRRLATTLDQAGGVVRILMGEALFDAGLGEGGFILQVPIADLRQRRDTLVLAVRRLSGGVEESDDGGDWGNALVAYQRLLEELAKQSAPELAVYLKEELLTPILDGLVDSVARRDPESLRRVAATSPVEVLRLSRLHQLAADLAKRMDAGDESLASAALSYFVSALGLFRDAFDEPQAGLRLVDLALPMPLAARQADRPDDPGRARLREMISWRAILARESECFLSCCESLDPPPAPRQQVMLDKVLQDVDRAADLYVQASASGGEGEMRAAVYALLVHELNGMLPKTVTPNKDPLSVLRRALQELKTLLEVPSFTPSDDIKAKVRDEQLAGEARWQELVKSLAPACVGHVELVNAGKDLLDRAIPGKAQKGAAWQPPVAVRVQMRKSVAESKAIAGQVRVMAAATEATASSRLTEKFVSLEKGLETGVGQARAKLRQDAELLGHARWLLRYARPLETVTIPKDLRDSLTDLFFEEKNAGDTIAKNDVTKFKAAVRKALAAR